MQGFFHSHISYMYWKEIVALFDAKTEVQMGKHFIHKFLMQYGGVIIQMVQVQELEDLIQYIHLVIL